MGPKDTLGKSQVFKRTAWIDGHNTSVHLEDAFWIALKEIAAAQRTTANQLIAAINSKRQHANLSSAIRLFVLSYYRSRVQP